MAEGTQAGKMTQGDTEFATERVIVCAQGIQDKNDEASQSRRQSRFYLKQVLGALGFGTSRGHTARQPAGLP